MIRDPFYRDIIEGLGGTLDPELFERCATDLLQLHVYPTLFPIRGGADAGRDAGIADGEGPGYPVVITTAEDVERNLRENLDRYLKEDQPRRQVVFATSRELTPPTERRLEKIAEERGFVLTATHDRAAFANLLYRSPEWCLELLGLVGKPQALSLLPSSRRPLLPLPLVGRDEDLVWLQEPKGDLLLVGQPGSGKTFLFHAFARENEALFVVADDLTQIAKEIRKKEPTCLLVDDAHLRPDLLTQLRRLREEIGYEGRIVANSWTGVEIETADALGVSGPSIRKLSLLSREDNAEVVRAAGIKEPIRLVAEIVDQASGRPGLAVTLAHLCLQEGSRAIATADLLYRTITTSFMRLVGKQAAGILAGFSVGGRAGMHMQSVANLLGIPLLDFRDAVAGLAAGGILHERGENRLAVHPSALRCALIREYFFGLAPLSLDEFLEYVPLIASAADTLMETRLRGGSVSDSLLQGLLPRADSERAWMGYAAVGPSQVQWILKNHPDKLNVIAPEALRVAPSEILEPLLTAAVGDERPLNANPEHPLRRIQDWIAAGRPGTGQALQRRKELLDAVERWRESAAFAIPIALQAFRHSMSPTFRATTTDPITERTLTLEQGVLSRSELSALKEQWARIYGHLSSSDEIDWEPVKDLIEDWAYPGRPPGHVPDDVATEMREFSERMLRNILDLPSAHPGIRLWAARMAVHADLKIDIETDPEFLILFPIERFTDDWREVEGEQTEAVRGLARRWSTEAPEAIASKLVEYEQFAQGAGMTYPRYTGLACDVIADSIEEGHDLWAKVLIESGAKPDLVGPFLHKALLEGAAWESVWQNCFESVELRGLAFYEALTSPTTPTDVIKTVLEDLSGHGGLIEHWCYRREIPFERLELLLHHKDPRIAAAIATGIAGAYRTEAIPKKIEASWREAVIKYLREGYELQEALKRDPSLAKEWLTAWFEEVDPLPLWRQSDVIKAAVSALSSDDRAEVLSAIPADSFQSSLVQELVGTDTGLYSKLLTRQDLRSLHLAPLDGPPSSLWVELAIFALDAGYEPQEVANAAYGSVWSWTGNASDMWLGRIHDYSELERHPDPRIQEVGRIGRERAESARSQALEEEHLEDVFGLDND